MKAGEVVSSALGVEASCRALFGQLQRTLFSRPDREWVATQKMGPAGAGTPEAWREAPPAPIAALAYESSGHEPNATKAESTYAIEL